MITAVLQSAPRVFARLRRRLVALRPRRSAPALLLAAVLAVSLGEPLACIVHCQLWLPAYIAAAAGHGHGQHGHDHGHGHQHGAATQAQAPAVVASALNQPGDTHAGGCVLRPVGASSSTPYHLPPSPVHEAVAAAAPLLLALLLTALLALPPILAPPRFAAPPPLTPPRSHAS
jgi:hypothetical protein